MVLFCGGEIILAPDRKCMRPIVSIVIPVYNASAFLREALDSVISQSFADWEAICVDDGSTDNSAAILEAYAGRDVRFRVLMTSRLGAGTARNAALNVARGDYIAFLDADDSYEPSFLEDMVRAIHGAEIAVCGANLYYGQTGVKERAQFYLECGKFEKGDRLNFTPGCPWNKLVSRELIVRCDLKFLTCSHSEDVFFTYPALAAAKSIAVVDKPLVNYRRDNPSSLEHTKGSRDILIFYEAYLETQHKLQELGVYSKVRASFIRRIGRAIDYNLRAPMSFTAFRRLLSRLRESAAQDFELLSDVSTAFDHQLRVIRRFGVLPQVIAYYRRRIRQALDKILWARGECVKD